MVHVKILHVPMSGFLIISINILKSAYLEMQQENFRVCCTNVSDHK